MNRSFTHCYRVAALAETNGNQQKKLPAKDRPGKKDKTNGITSILTLNQNLLQTWKEENVHCTSPPNYIYITIYYAPNKTKHTCKALKGTVAKWFQDATKRTSTTPFTTSRAIEERTFCTGATRTWRCKEGPVWWLVDVSVCICICNVLQVTFVYLNAGG